MDRRVVGESIVVAPVRRSRISQQIVVQLCQMIRRGQIRPGDRLPSERELTEQLQVSRASVREALRALEIAGIIEARHGGGTYVRVGFESAIVSPLSLVLDASADLVGDLWEVRTIFEPAIAAHAAMRAEPEQVAVLDQILEQQHEYLHQIVSNAAWVESDQDFHVAIACASRNEVSLRVSRLINELLHERRSYFATSAERREHAVMRHREILDAIRRRDAHDAREAMVRHLREVEDFILGDIVAPAGGQGLHD